MKPLSKQEMVDAMTTNIDATYNLLNTLVDQTTSDTIGKLYDQYIDDIEEEDEEEMYSGYLPTNLEVQLVCVSDDEWAVDVRERAEHEDDADEHVDGYSFDCYKDALALYKKAVAYHEHHPFKTDNFLINIEPTTEGEL